LQKRSGFGGRSQRLSIPPIVLVLVLAFFPFHQITFKIEDEHEYDNEHDSGEGEMDSPSGRLGEEGFPSRCSPVVADDSYQSSD
jgi:hypothetical protein